MHEVRIKVCGMRVPENIAGVSGLKPDYLGFIFYPKSKRYVSDLNVEGILNAVPNGIKKVGVFVNETIPEIIKKVNLFKLEILQIHGNEPPGYCEELKALGFTVIKAFGVDQSFSFKKLEDYQPNCDFFLFDTKSPGYGGAGEKFDWRLLTGYNNNKPFFLSGGIGPKDVDTIRNIDGLNIHALDINSKFETEPALKDIGLLEEFITGIRS